MKKKMIPWSMIALWITISTLSNSRRYKVEVEVMKIEGNSNFSY